MLSISSQSDASLPWFGFEKPASMKLRGGKSNHFDGLMVMVMDFLGRLPR